MKVDKVSFSYRGGRGDGHDLASLLSDISVFYESNDGEVTGCADLGALLRALLTHEQKECGCDQPYGCPGHPDARGTGC